MSSVVKTDPNIFSVTQIGDRKIMEAHQKAIVLVGLTRVGKSTVFNWLLKKPMIGKGNHNSHFVPLVTTDSDVAQVGNSFSSVTLAPNIAKDFQNGLSLVDMAGYEDTRDYVGVIGVSYFLKALFDQVKKVKFVIVLDENKFGEETSAGLIKTFQGFINMFDFSKMSDVIKGRIKDSMSLVVSRSKNPENHYEYITEILAKMQDPNFLFDQKPLIMQLLAEMRDSARILPFPAAKDKQNAQQCQIISKFNKKGWQFFDFTQNQEEAKVSAEAKVSLINLPFQKDFDKLPIAQQEKFKDELQNKITNYLKYSDILRLLVDNFERNWKEFLVSWKQDKVFNLDKFKLTQVFAEVKKFNVLNDVYKTNVVSVQFKIDYQAPTLIKSIKSILDLQQIVSKASVLQNYEPEMQKVVDPITNQETIKQVLVQNTFYAIIEKFKKFFAEMVKILKKFATSKEQDQLLERTNFILQRGFREFQKLYDLNPNMVNDIKVRLTANCDGVFEMGPQTLPWHLKFRQNFVRNLDENLLIKLFPTLEALKQYEDFFNEYVTLRKQQAQATQSTEEKNKNNIFFSQQICIISMAKADLLSSLSFREKALKCFIQAFKNIQTISICISETNLYDQQATKQELNKLTMKKLKLIKKIVTMLKSITEGDTKFYKKLALQLSKHHYMIDDTCKIYQLLIDIATNDDKCNLYQQYSNYCSAWGRKEQARILLQKKLTMEEDSFDEYSSTIEKLRELQTNQKENSRIYEENLRKLGRVNVRDDETDKIIYPLEEEVKKLIELAESKVQVAQH